ncbi:hypothetical protein L596_017714 [Steinernema carpocapsae]|uniref:F-box associated domain-containing protein n=1 Tax=Steinernema carpocapsae TaxID=34508 RepID=A0A4U5N2T2_STECR|nr:hypothetical protein L596_017714 [Steinernema carpocapsae]
MEAVIRNSFCDSFKASFTRVSGSFGFCAARFKEEGHHTMMAINDGVLAENVCYRDQFGRSIPSQNVEYLLSKYRLRKILIYTGCGDVVPPIDPKLNDQITHSFEEPGELSLFLACANIDDKWIDLFLAWKSLKRLFIHLGVDKPIVKLLKKLLRQKQLINLDCKITNVGTKEANLLCKFLFQEQFLNLTLWPYNEDIANQIITTRILNWEVLNGKTVTFIGKVPLPEANFDALGRVEIDLVRFRSEHMVVDYFNWNATPEMREEEFLNRAQRTKWRFV